MSAMESQIIWSRLFTQAFADERKHQSSASLESTSGFPLQRASSAKNIPVEDVIMRELERENVIAHLVFSTQSAARICPNPLAILNNVLQSIEMKKKLQDRHLEDKFQGLYSLSGKASYQQILHVSKLQYGMLQCSYRSQIWQESRQRCCRGACQISEWLKKLKPESRGFRLRGILQWDLCSLSE